MTASRDPAAWSGRLYDLLLLAYPQLFRARFEVGMHHAFQCDLHEARTRGTAACLRFWLVTIVDTVRFGFAERLTFTERSRPRKPWRIRMRAALTIDLRDSWRSLRATPVVTAVAVLSLALGIGANAALFSILNTLIFKSLPVRDPAGLVVVDHGSWTNPIWEQIRDRQRDIADGAFAWSAERFDLSSSGTDIVDGMFASGRIFEVLGVPAVRGRTFSEDDDRRGGPGGPVAVISHAFWQRRYAGADDALGRTIAIDRVPFTIIGVTPPGFFGPDVGRSFDVAIPIGTEPLLRGENSALDGRSNWWLNIMLRLRPGQTLEEATERLRSSQPQIRAATLPGYRHAEDKSSYLSDPFTLVPGGRGMSSLRTRYERPLTVIMFVVGMVLLIACANIANLMLARAVARRHELSVRLALGASRARLSRQLIVESLMLTGMGTVLGSLFARWASGALVARLTTPDNQVYLDLAVDWRVLGFTAAAACTTTLLFGLAPALAVSGVAPNDALKEHARGAVGDGRLRVRGVLVVVQVALSLALVVAAGLFTRTFAALTTRDVGFDRRSVLILNVSVKPREVPAGARLALFERLRQAAAGVPGVTRASTSFTTPVAGSGWNTPIVMPGSTLGARQRLTWVNAVSPGWFETFGVHLSAGRDFDGRDRLGAPRVAVVNRTFARRFLGTDNPIGLRFTEDQSPGPPYEVIGMVEDSVYRSLRAAMMPTMFIPMGQWTDSPTGVAIGLRAASGDPLTLAKAVAAAVSREEPNAALSFRSLADQVGSSLMQERLVATLSACFGGLALVLAALGLYGITSYAVSRRRMEIGIRMALGTDRSGVVRLVLGGLARLIGIGLVLGAALSTWATRFVGTLLYGLEPRDPVTFAGAALLLMAVGAIAGWLPARRAARIDPVDVLRH
jgi:putative ABC transport system permease protein